MYDLLLVYREMERLKKVDRLIWLKDQQYYDNVTLIASTIAKTPMAFLTVVKKDTQEFKSAHGVAIAEIPRHQSFCQHTLEKSHGEYLLVEDASLDERFKENPLVIGPPFIRFYCGFPLITNNSVNIGALCVVDTTPQKISDAQLHALSALSVISKEFHIPVK